MLGTEIQLKMKLELLVLFVTLSIVFSKDDAYDCDALMTEQYNHKRIHCYRLWAFNRNCLYRMQYALMNATVVLMQRDCIAPTEIEDIYTWSGYMATYRVLSDNRTVLLPSVWMTEEKYQDAEWRTWSDHRWQLHLKAHIANLKQILPAWVFESV